MANMEVLERKCVSQLDTQAFIPSTQASGQNNLKKDNYDQRVIKCYKRKWLNCSSLVPIEYLCCEISRHLAFVLTPY